MRTRIVGVCVVVACGGGSKPFPLRAPFAVDTDLQPVSVACKPEPSKKEPDRMRCAPSEYESPFVWNHIDNIVFAPLSRSLSIHVNGEAANANSMDEVPESSWFRPRPLPLTSGESLGACKPEDMLTGEVPDGTWTIDHGKDNGASLGFRVDVPGKGLYMLKADQPDNPELASGASVIGAAMYDAAGFYTSCEQIVVIKKSQLKLAPGLTTTSNAGITKPFDDKALDAVLATATPVGQGGFRMQASKWLPGLTLGPFRYVGTRGDDPNDVIAHEDRRELRGSRILAAWMSHWDAREQNSMDLWFATNAKEKRSSPGFVRHYIIDTSDSLGGGIKSRTISRKLGYAYAMSIPDMVVDFVTLGVIKRPWEGAEITPGHEKFGVFASRDFDPQGWRGLYPNPAMVRMTERDAAWMARIIARFTREDVTAIVASGKFADPSDTAYLTNILLERQQRILARYLTRLSPLADVHTVGKQICALDLARSTHTLPAEQFHYRVTQRIGGKRIELAAAPAADGTVCFEPQALAPDNVTDSSPQRLVVFEVRNGTSAGPLAIHAYDLGARGMTVVGLTRSRN